MQAADEAEERAAAAQERAAAAETRIQELITELESHEHYETPRDSFEKPKVGRLFILLQIVASVLNPKPFSQQCWQHSLPSISGVAYSNYLWSLLVTHNSTDSDDFSCLCWQTSDGEVVVALQLKLTQMEEDMQR